MDTVTISALGGRGEGVATLGERRIFVPFTLPGDTVDIDIEDERGTVVSFRDQGPGRVDPLCAYFGSCGGCALQHAGPATYAAFKRGLVASALEHAGIETQLDPLVDARGQGRRRAILHADRSKAGYMRARSHDLLDVEACPILVPVLKQMAPVIARTIGALIGKCDVLVTATATGVDAAIRCDRSFKAEKLAPVGRRLNLARLSLNGETVVQQQQPLVRMGRAGVELPPDSFLQATEAAEEALGALVQAGVGPAKAIADLFCGVGPFALRLAEKSRIGAFDADRHAIAALNKAVRFTQGLKPVTAVARDLFRDPLAPVELEPFDAIVFDPPRAGAEAQAREIARSGVKRVVAVSCDPRTFARDVSLLIAGGYRLERVTPVDQFAWSPHVEIVGVLRR